MNKKEVYLNRKILIISFLSGSGRYLIVSALYFFFTPYMINSLGVERFGIWALIGSIITSLRSVDLGLGMGVTKFVAEAVRESNYTKLNDFFWVSAAISMAFATFLVILIWFSRPFVMNAVHIGGIYWDETYSAFSLGCLTLWIGAASKIFGKLLDGLQRMDLNNSIQTVTSVLTVILMFFVLLNNGSLFDLMVVNLLGYFVTLIISVIFIYHLLPTFKVSFSGLNLEFIKRMFKYSFVIQLGSLATILIEPVSKLLLGSMLSSVSVSAFEMGNRAVSVFRQIINAGMAALMPAGALLMKNNKADLSKLYLITTKLSSLISMIFTLVVIVFAKMFSSLWIGGGLVNEVAQTVIILMVCGWFSSVVSPAYNLAQGAGFEKESSITMGIALITMIIFMPIGVFVLGYEGALFGYLLGVITSSAYLFVTFNKQLLISSKDMVSSLLYPIIINIPLFLVALVFVNITTSESWPTLIGLALIYVTLSVGMTYLFGIKKTEQQELNHQLNVLFIAFREKFFKNNIKDSLL